MHFPGKIRYKGLASFYPTDRGPASPATDRTQAEHGFAGRNLPVRTGPPSPVSCTRTHAGQVQGGSRTSTRHVPATPGMTSWGIARSPCREGPSVRCHHVPFSGFRTGRFPLVWPLFCCGDGSFQSTLPCPSCHTGLAFFVKICFLQSVQRGLGQSVRKSIREFGQTFPCGRHFQNLKAASADVCNDASAVACQAPYNVRYTTLHTFAQHTGTASRHQGQQTGMACLSPCACRLLPLLLPSLSRNPVQPAPSAALPGAPSVPSSPARDNMQDGQTDGCISRKSPGMSLSLAAGRACPCRIPRKERRTFSLKTC